MIQQFNFQKTEIRDLYIIDPFVAWDNRGSFTKDYSKEVFQINNIEHDLQEVFYTDSHKGVIRAMHFQRVKQQPKLVRCVFGHVFDVVADLRKDSETFGRWIGFDLSEENKKEILIPAGCAHGYLVIDHSIVSYKCAEKFYGDYDDGFMWNDNDIAIQWPLDLVGGIENIILADKDKNLQSFAEFKNKYGGF
jgi:dTDP-4-dehydrorhamnose 3,5-epimerase